jgi:TonB-linked SusC/RagA family outer membrane protein
MIRLIYRKTYTSIVLMLLFSLQAFSQNTITGKVTDAKDGSPLPGVTVTVKGTTTAAQTQSDGTFSLVAPAGSTLVFTSVGFTTQEAPVRSGTVNISLVQSNQQLNEVVVVGYGTQKKKDLTGAVTAISSKDFVKGAITTPEQLIAGKVAGVSIIGNGGAPGAGSTIRIRGGASLSASNDPLIVIDGVPLDNFAGDNNIKGSPNALSLINPNDIETFNILKDASATAIYGSRASNGVIIITTKRGRKGKPVFNFSTLLSVSQIANKVDVLSAGQYRDYVNAKGSNAQKALLGTANTDWQDEIYQTALSTDNNLSITGGVKDIPFRVSVGYLNQDGILRTANLARASASISVSPMFFDNHLKVDINLKGSNTKSRFPDEGAIGSAVSFDPTQPVFSSSAKYGAYTQWLDGGTVSGLNSLAPRNPVGMLEQRKNVSNANRSIGNIQLDYKLHWLPELRANLNLGYDASNGSGDITVSDSAATDYKRFEFPAGSGQWQSGRREEYLGKKSNTLAEFYLNYVKDLKSIDSRVDIMAGTSYQDFKTTNYSFANYALNGTMDPNSKPIFEKDIPQNRLLSYYGRLNYGYKSRYLLTASIRTDGSSRFSPENRWGIFPSAAFAWRVKDEMFLRNSNVVSDFKIRLGYGITGQQEGIGNYDYISYYNLSNLTAQYQFGDKFYQMYRPGGYYENRKWEQTTTSNIGVDFGFLDNRISGSIDYYFKKTKDLLSLIAQPAGINFANEIVANVGNMENRGIEFTINANPVRTTNINWDINFNVTHNKNKITNLTQVNDPDFPGNRIGGISGGTGTNVQINSVGFPRASFYVYQQVYDAAGKPIDNLFVDQNGDGIINDNDLYRYKNPDGQVLFGASSSVTYKKWNAGFVMRASVGNYVYNNVFSNTGTNRNIFSIPSVLKNGSTNLLETNFSGNGELYYNSDYFVQNASFLRMDNINIGYNVGKVLKNKANVRVTGNVQNAFVITKYKGIDPEINGGIDNQFYPRPRVFVLGVNLDF